MYCFLETELSHIQEKSGGNIYMCFNFQSQGNARNVRESCKLQLSIDIGKIKFLVKDYKYLYVELKKKVYIPQLLLLLYHIVWSQVIISLLNQKLLFFAESSTSVMTNHCANLKAPLLMVQTLGSVDFQDRHCEVVSLRCIFF